jgi:DNA-binding MarR family transcriptional regulator
MKELAWDIAATAQALRRQFDRHAGEIGVTRAQWRVLAWLSREPGLKQVELAERLDVEPISACRMVDRLEEAGLVERQRDPADRRAWRVVLTAKAEPVLARLRALAEDTSQAAFGSLGEDRITALRDSLAEVRDNINAQENLRRGTE